MLVSSSFLSSKNVPKDLTKLNDTSTDYIHVDIMDGKFVKGKTMPFSEMKHIYKYTSKRLDVHLMVLNPSKYIKDYATLNTEYITFHLEIEQDIIENLNLIKSYGIKCGLAIKPDTGVSELVPFLPLLDLIIIMSVEPGMGGQEFIPETEEKISEIKVLLQEYNSSAKMSVDGGVNNITKKYCSDCDILVAGSYITNSECFEEAIKALK